LPANRFILLIHDLTKTDLKKLDDLMHRYLKFMARYAHSGSFLPVHSGLGMDVKSSRIFTNSAGPWILLGHWCEGTTLFRLQCGPRFSVSRGGPGNAIFVHAAKVAETVLLSKEPVIGDAAVVEPPLAIHCTQPQDLQPPQSPLHAEPGDLDFSLHPHPIVEPGPQPPQVEPIPTQADSVLKVSAIRKEVGRVFHEDDAWAARVCGYTMQRNLFALLQAESEGITWKSCMWNLPRGVLKFALTLPTFTNLKKWEKRASVNCHLYGNTVKQMRFHVLVHCNHTMDQGRMTQRHDSVLKHIVGCLNSALESLRTVEVYCDLEGLQAPDGGSILASVMVQIQRPDLVIHDRSVHGLHRISLVELMCPWDTDKARDYKISRYAGLREELSNQGWDCGLYMIEVGARPYFQGGKGPSSVFIPVFGPFGAQIWCCADDEVCQLDIPGLFVFYFSGLQQPCLDYSPSC
jgi:hypothetical protein